MRVIPAVKAILFKPNGYFLVVKQQVPGGAAFWNLPGGRVEPGEDPYIALKRELQEELGLELDIGPCLGMWWFVRTDGDQIVATTFRVDVSRETEPSVQCLQSSNITDHKWITKDEFLDDSYVASHESLKNLIRTSI